MVVRTSKEYTWYTNGDLVFPGPLIMTNLLMALSHLPYQYLINYNLLAISVDLCL